jgi:hypothetical protein
MRAVSNPLIDCTRFEAAAAMELEEEHGAGKGKAKRILAGYRTYYGRNEETIFLRQQSAAGTV